MTDPVPFSWAPVTIRPLPSDSIRTNAPDGPGALNHQPDATPIDSPAASGPSAWIRATAASSVWCAPSPSWTWRVGP